MRVLRVIYSLRVGGVQRMMLRGLKALATRGVHSEVCCLKERGDLADDFEKAGFPVHVIPFTTRLDPIALFKLRRLVRRGRFNIIHAHMYAANLPASIAMIGAKDIGLITSYHSFKPAETNSQARWIRRTQNIPKAIVAVSASVADSLVQIGVARDKIRIIHNGLHVPALRDPLVARRETEPIELLWAGRFVGQKRIPFLVDVMERCRTRGVAARLTLLGEGPNREKIRRKVSEKGLEEWVRFEEVTSDVTPYLRRCDLFVLASEREGFSNALLEAAAAGRGMILSDIPPHHELLDGARGGIIPGDNPERWAGTIAHLSQHREEIDQLGKDAFEMVQKFSMDNVAEKYLNLYRSFSL